MKKINLSIFIWVAKEFEKRLLLKCSNILKRGLKINISSNKLTLSKINRIKLKYKPPISISLEFSSLICPPFWTKTSKSLSVQTIYKERDFKFIKEKFGVQMGFIQVTRTQFAWPFTLGLSSLMKKKGQLFNLLPK